MSRFPIRRHRMIVEAILIVLLAGACTSLPFEAPLDGIWDELGEYSEGLVAVKNGSRWGYADESGLVAILPQFAEALPFSDGRAAVRLTTRWGFVDRKGQYIVRPTYEDIGPYSEGLAAVRTKKGWGYIDLGGHMAIPEDYDEAGPFSQGLAAVRLGSRWGYISQDGRDAIRFEFKAAGRFSEGKAPAALLRDDNEWGYVDRSGRFVIEAGFDGARSFSEGSAAILIDGRWGFIDESGALAVNPRFEEVGDFAWTGDFTRELAPAKEEGLWGILRVDGSFAVKPRWKELGNFHGELARAASGDGRAALIDAVGAAVGVTADSRKARLPAAVGDTSETVTVRIEVRDHLSNAPVQGYRIVSALGTYGEYEIPDPPESGKDGLIQLSMEKSRYEQTKDLFGKKNGWFDSALDVSEHKISGYAIRTLSADAELPRIDEVILTREKEKEGSNILIQQEEFIFKKPGKSSLEFKTNNGKFKVKSYFLQQGTKRQESGSSSFNIDVGNAFSINDVIHAGIVIDFKGMSIAMPTLLKIREDPELKQPVDFPQSPSASLPKVDFLDGFSGGLQLPGLKLGVEYEDDVITLYVGINPEAEKAKHEGWKGPFKSFMNEMAEGNHSINRLMDFYNGHNPRPFPKGEGVFKASAGALGYVELSHGEGGKLEVIGGHLTIFGEFGYEFNSQMMAGFIPVYASLGMGGEIAVKFASDPKQKPKSFKDFFHDVTLTVGPYVDVEGGVGIKGLLSIGLALHGAIEMTFNLTKGGEFAGEMLLDFFIRLRALFVFTWEKKIAGAKWEVGHHAHESGEPPPTLIPETGELSSMLKMESKDYLATGSQWLGDRAPPMARKGEDPFTLQELKRNILPGSEPLIYLFSGGEALFWIDNSPGGRAASDMTALMYSIRNKDQTWSDPKIVDDDGTGDYDFAVIEHSGVLYAAWHNTTKKFDRKEVELDEVCKNSEILVAAWDPKTGNFGKPVFVDGRKEGIYFGKPRLASDGRTLALAWVRNSEGDYYQAKGSTYYQSAKQNGASWVIQDGNLYEASYHKPVIGWDFAVSDREPHVVICRDEDGSLKTIDDRKLVLAHAELLFGRWTVAEESITDRGRFGNPRVARWRGKDALFYYAGDGDTGRGNIHYFANLFSRGWGGVRKEVLGNSVAMSDNFSLVSGSGDRFGVLTVTEETGLRSNPAMIVYDPKRDAWGYPSRIAKENPDPTLRAEAARGVWRSDDRIDIVYRSLPASAGGRGAPPTTTLALASTLPAPDLAINPNAIYKYYGPVKGGELLPITAVIENRGLASAKGVALELFAKQEGNAASRTGYWSLDKNVELRPGESATLSLDYRLPESSESPYALFLFGDPLSGVEELNRGNNYAYVPFAVPDLCLGDVALKRSGFERHFTVPVENRSSVRVRYVELILYDELQGGNVVKSFSWDYIEPFTTKVADFTIDLGEMDWKSGPRKRLLFVVKSSDVKKPGYHSEPFVLINPYSYPAFSLAVFDARSAGPNYVWVSAAAANMHPEQSTGDLLIEILDQAGKTEASYKERVRAERNRSALVSHTFKVNGNPSSYSVRVTMSNVPKALPGSAKTGGLMEPGGDPLPVEVPVSPAKR